MSPLRINRLPIFGTDLFVDKYQFETWRHRISRHIICYRLNSSKMPITLDGGLRELILLKFILSQGDLSVQTILSSVIETLSVCNPEPLLRNSFT